MAYYVPLSGFIAQGFGRRPRRRRSLPPISLNWTTIEAAPFNGLAVLDTVTVQNADQIDMVQCVKWDNPIGATVWLQSDSGDLVKLPPYSNGVQPLLVGQGDKINVQLDPAYGPPSPAWPNTVVTLLSVPAEQAASIVGSSFASMPAGNNPMLGIWNPTLQGYATTEAFDGFAVTAAATTLFRLPQRATDNVSSCGSVAITGYDISLVVSGFAAAANLALQLSFGVGSGSQIAQAVPLEQVIQFPTATPAPIQISRKGISYAAQLGLAVNPHLQLQVSAAPGGTITASGSVDLLLMP